MGQDKRAKQLDAIRGLVQRNMPRTVVYTKRQPLSDNLMNAIRNVSDNEDALDFLESEDDANAAVALASLYAYALTQDSEDYQRVRQEIDAFKRRFRSVYLAELGNLLQDSSYDEIIDEKIFRERAFRSKNNNATLIVRFSESIDSLMDEVLPAKDGEKSVKEVEKTAQWFHITYKKIIDRCKAYLTDNNITRDDKQMVSLILKRSMNDQKMIDQILDSYHANPDDLSGLTWAEALERVM